MARAPGATGTAVGTIADDMGTQRGVLSDNLFNASSGTRTASIFRWLIASLGTVPLESLPWKFLPSGPVRPLSFALGETRGECRDFLGPVLHDGRRGHG